MAKHNLPCSACIQWSNTYGKVLISKRLHPLTMKSEGLCPSGGGKITFQTSGQQIVVVPPTDPLAANGVAHSNPLFRESDMQRRNETLATQYNPAKKAHIGKALVNRVRVNGSARLSLRTYEQEDLVFTTALTTGGTTATPVKWDVTRDGKDIAVGLSEPPSRTLFTEEGQYRVYAYVNRCGNRLGGGCVDISVSTPKFTGLEWLDANGHKTKIIGKRQEVFAKATLEGCGKIPISARFYCWGTNGVESISSSPISVKPDSNGIARISLSLTGSQARKLQDFKLTHGAPANIWLSLTGGEWIENLREAENHPIGYSADEAITGLMFYTDEGCTQPSRNPVECGQTLHARVTTRNIDNEQLTLYISRSGNNGEEEKNNCVYYQSGDIGVDGTARFRIETSEDWIKDRVSTFCVRVVEGISSEEVVVVPNGDNRIVRNTERTFSMNKNEAVLTLYKKPQPVEKGQSVTTVQEVKKKEQKDCVCKKYDLIWGRSVDCPFRKKIVQVAKDIGLPQEKYEGANWLMAVIALETKRTFNPSIQNSLGYTGLIQFGSGAASSVGTTTSALKRMTAVEQLDYVKKYFNLQRFKGKLNTLTDLYLAVLYPSACGHGNEKNYIVLKDKAYRANPVFFKEKDEKDEEGNPQASTDGKTYIWEIEEVIRAFYEKGITWKEMRFKCMDKVGQINKEEDVVIVFEKGVDSATIAESSILLIKEMARKSANNKIYITSTVRTPRKQAQIMYSYIVSEGLQNQYNLYGPNGDKVIDVYVSQKRLNKNKEEIIKAMEEKINKLGADNVSRHCGNHAIRNVFDISYNPQKMKNPKGFLQQINLKVKDGTISKFINESKRNCFHIEIKQNK